MGYMCDSVCWNNYYFINVSYFNSSNSDLQSILLIIIILHGVLLYYIDIIII